MYDVVGPWLLWLRAVVPDSALADVKDSVFPTLAECRLAGIEWVMHTTRNRTDARMAEALCVGEMAEDTVMGTTNPAIFYTKRKGDEVMLLVATYCQPRCLPSNAIEVPLLSWWRDVSRARPKLQ